MTAPAAIERQDGLEQAHNVIRERQGHYIAGGIMIGKSLIEVLPAGGYIDDDGPPRGDGSAKIVVWKLGSEFFHEKSESWTKSF